MKLFVALVLSVVMLFCGVTVRRSFWNLLMETNFPRRIWKAITNGRRSQRAPHHAYISYTASDGSGYYGGGSLISNLHVVTAAHIISTFVRWNVGLGSGEFSELRFHSTDKAFLHPNYNQRSSRDNDIGIILLTSTVIFSGSLSCQKRER